MSDDLYELAPPGQIYVCGACGKQSRNRAGWLKGTHERVAISDGWDESCMLHAVLCYDRPSNNPNYRWESVPPDEQHHREMLPTVPKAKALKCASE